MACTITQDDLGPAFADVDADLATFWIDAATSTVLGPLECQTATYAAWSLCCVDVCQAVKYLASHMIASDPTSGVTAGVITSERVGEVAVAYGSSESTSGLYAGTIYGRMYTSLLAKYEACSNRRNTLPLAVFPAGRCGC